MEHMCRELSPFIFSKAKQKVTTRSRFPYCQYACCEIQCFIETLWFTLAERVTLFLLLVKIRNNNMIIFFLLAQWSRIFLPQLRLQHWIVLLKDLTYLLDSSFMLSREPYLSWILQRFRLRVSLFSIKCISFMY